MPVESIKNRKLFLAEGNSSLHAAIKYFIEKELQCNVAGTAQTFEQLINHKQLFCADILLIDINLPGQTSYEAAKYILELNHRANLIALTMSNENIELLDIILAGFKGIVLKDKIGEELEKAMLALINNGSYYPANVFM
ncbi:MAG: response regulator [Bacteroidales bacterium]